MPVVTCVRCGQLTVAPGGTCRLGCRHCGWPYPDGDCSDGGWRQRGAVTLERLLAVAGVAALVLLLLYLTRVLGLQVW